MQLHLLQQYFLIRLIFHSVLWYRTKGIKGWYLHFERTLTFAQEAVLIKKTPCRMLTGLIVAKIKRRMKVKTQKKWSAFEILEILIAWKCLICKNTSSCSSSRWGNFKMWQCHPFERGKKRGFGGFDWSCSHLDFFLHDPVATGLSGQGPLTSAEPVAL